MDANYGKTFNAADVRGETQVHPTQTGCVKNYAHIFSEPKLSVLICWCMFEPLSCFGFASVSFQEFHVHVFDGAPFAGHSVAQTGCYQHDR